MEDLVTIKDPRKKPMSILVTKPDEEEQGSCSLPLLHGLLSVLHSPTDPCGLPGIPRDSTGTGWELGVDSFVTMLTKRLIPSPTPVPLQSTWSHFHKDCPTGSPWEYRESQLGEIPWIPSGVPLEGRGSLPVILKKKQRTSRI